MNKKLLYITIYAFIAFCVISYISVMTWLLFVNRTAQQPVANIGFPFKYYYQFWVRGSDIPNSSWNLEAFVLDYIITWVFSAIVYSRMKEEEEELPLDADMK